MLARGDIHDDVLAAARDHDSRSADVARSKLATVYVMPLGGHDVGPVIAALKRNKHFIRGEVAHAVNLKFAPDIRFRRTRVSRRRRASTVCSTATRCGAT